MQIPAPSSAGQLGSAAPLLKRSATQRGELGACSHRYSAVGEQDAGQVQETAVLDAGLDLVAERGVERGGLEVADLERAGDRRAQAVVGHGRQHDVEPGGQEAAVHQPGRPLEGSAEGGGRHQDIALVEDRERRVDAAGAQPERVAGRRRVFDAGAQVEVVLGEAGPSRRIGRQRTDGSEQVRGNRLPLRRREVVGHQPIGQLAQLRRNLASSVFAGHRQATLVPCQHAQVLRCPG